MANMGERIRKARRAAGLTQDELAERVGVRAGTILRWENGHQEPRGRRLQAIADATGKSVAWLQTGHDGNTVRALINGVWVEGAPDVLLEALERSGHAPPAAAGEPEPGVVALLGNGALCDALCITDDERNALLQVRGGTLATQQRAITFLLAVLRGEERAPVGPAVQERQSWQTHARHCERQVHGTHSAGSSPPEGRARRRQYRVLVRGRVGNTFR